MVTRCSFFIDSNCFYSVSVSSVVFVWFGTINDVIISPYFFFFLSPYFVVSMSTKRAAVEKQMEINRLKEELPLIKREMNSFISFYKDGIIPSIEKKKMEMQASLIGNSVY